MNRGGFDLFESAIDDFERLQAGDDDIDAGEVQESLEVSLIILNNIKSATQKAAPEAHQLSENGDYELASEMLETSIDLEYIIEDIAFFISDINALNVPSASDYSLSDLRRLVRDLRGQGIDELSRDLEEYIAALDEAFVWKDYRELASTVLDRLMKKHRNTWESDYAKLYINQLMRKYPQDEAAKWIADHIEKEATKYGIDKSLIHSVVPEKTIANGVEIVTKPVSFNTQAKLMPGVFRLIEKFGSTSKDTGLHVNMSIRGKNFDTDNFNPLKLALLLDNKYMLRSYPVRNLVSDIWDSISSEALIAIAKDATMNIDNHKKAFSTNIKHIERALFNLIKFEGKYQGINFENLFLSDRNEQRIEFRYPGNVDYTKRYDELIATMERFAFMMFAAYDKTFGEKEYKQKLAQQLNRLSMKYFEMSWSELVKVVRSDVTKVSA